MYYANCEWYVDMGEHNKPLCERKGLRPAKCGECPVYIMSIEEENAKLREYATKLEQTNDQLSNDNCELLCDMQNIQQFFIDNNTKLRKLVRDMWDAALHPETFGDGSHLLMRMRELGIEDYDD